MNPKPTLVRLAAMLLLLVVAACSPAAEQRPLTTGSFQPVTGRDLRLVTGQLVYVPAYSEVFYSRGAPNQELAVTLAIHNTDLDAPIIIQSVRLYDTDGNIIQDYIEEPVEVSPLATTGFLAEGRGTTGDWGRNFVVQWAAEEPVYEPIIEAIMVSTRGTHGISLVSLGRVISQTEPINLDELDEPIEEAP